MKHIVLLILVLTMSFGMIYAQSYFGVKGGMNISRITGDDALPSSDSHLGMHAGAFMMLNLSRSLYIQPELIYTQKGFNYKFNNNVDFTKHAISLDYVEVPVLIKLNVAIDSVKIQPYAGAAISYLVRAKDKETISSPGTSTTNTYNIDNQINDLGAGFIVGLEVILMDKFMFGGRYNFGLTNIYENGDDVQNGVFMLSLGYLFSN